MGPIPKTFFITGLGRSGTQFLARLLDRSPSYRVIHEWHLPVPGLRDTWFQCGWQKRFPLYRFLLARYPWAAARPGYGEVNSLLRFALDASRPGSERYIGKRGVIVRDPRDVIASVMNRRGHKAEDFPHVVRRVLTSYFRLLALTQLREPAYATFRFERMTTDLDYLRDVVAWTGIDDIQVEAADLATKVNVNKASWFPRWPEWEKRYVSIYAELEGQLRTGGAET